MKPIKLWKFLLALLLVHSSSLALAQSDVSAIEILTPQGTGSGGVNKIAGWQFTVNETFTINALGILDRECSQPLPTCMGLAQEHEVAIWDSQKNLLATTVIPMGMAAPFLDPEFRYLAITPIELQAGESYTIAGFQPAPDDDGTKLCANGTQNDWAADPRISVSNGVWKPFVGGFGFPNNATNYPNPCLGPNFRIQGAADADGDGVLDENDNCPAVANSDQLDTDNDGQGNACDNDDDADGVNDDTPDNCRLTPNSDQADLDNDGVGDACDGDTDGDGVDNNADNCPVTANADQADFDADTLGDACDADSDGDNVTNESDSCSFTTPGDAVKPRNGCSVAQLCPCGTPDSDWTKKKTRKKHKSYAQCVQNKATRFKQLGLITKQEKRALISDAKASSCVKNPE
ncbi:MAG: thrombospondin type 3 repeat-containing protein [Pseudomonadota bacterium]